MKEIKNTFVLSTSYLVRFKRLTDAQMGALLRAVMTYELTGGTEGIEMDEPTRVAFDSVAFDLDENRARYEETCRRNSENGAQGGRPKKTDRFSENRTVPKKSGRFRKTEQKRKKPIMIMIMIMII